MALCVVGGSMFHSVSLGVVCGILCHGGSMWHSVSWW